MEKVIKKKGNKLYVKWKDCGNSFNSWIDKKMSQYFPKPYEPFGGDINVTVDLSNYATKTHLKNTTRVDISKLAAKFDLASLKAEIDKIDVDKIKNYGLKIMKNRLKTVPVDLSKLSNAVNNDVVKKLCMIN